MLARRLEFSSWMVSNSHVAMCSCELSHRRTITLSGVMFMHHKRLDVMRTHMSNTDVSSVLSMHTCPCTHAYTQFMCACAVPDLWHAAVRGVSAPLLCQQ